MIDKRYKKVARSHSRIADSQGKDSLSWIVRCQFQQFVWGKITALL
jgi:hypothetical protein